MKKDRSVSAVPRPDRAALMSMETRFSWARYGLTIRQWWSFYGTMDESSAGPRRAVARLRRRVFALPAPVSSAVGLGDARHARAFSRWLPAFASPCWLMSTERGAYHAAELRVASLLHIFRGDNAQGPSPGPAGRTPAASPRAASLSTWRQASSSAPATSISSPIFLRPSVTTPRPILCSRWCGNLRVFVVSAAAQKANHQGERSREAATQK